MGGILRLSCHRLPIAVVVVSEKCCASQIENVCRCCSKMDTRSSDVTAPSDNFVNNTVYMNVCTVAY